MLRVYEPPTTTVSKISMASESAFWGDHLSGLSTTDQGTSKHVSVVMIHGMENNMCPSCWRNQPCWLQFLLAKASCWVGPHVCGFWWILVDFGGNLAIYIV
jgi:hypothetical protein